MTGMHDARSEITRVAHLLGPRLLTQASRDPSVDTFGCFDRNYWHYRIRDFPSAILQQGALACVALSELDAENAQASRFLTDLARGGAEFWNRRAVRHGAFEEYYPFERGYPPLAFSTLTVGLLVDRGIVSPAAVDSGAKVAAKQLLNRFEPEAANQQVAGMAALAVLRRTLPEHIDEGAYKSVVDRTFGLQTEEGWFAEYGGPDLGYLSVAVDCLWDYYDATGDDRAVESINAATRFTSALIGNDRTSVGMHNSRNTDYVVPYGLLRTALAGISASDAAARLFTQLFGEIGPGHFLMTTDDRYLTHYLGTSLFRAAALASTAEPVDPAEADSLPSHALFAGCGQAIWRFDHGTVRTSLAKGGIVTYAGEHPFTDFGVGIQSGDDYFVSHWWSEHWEHEVTDRGFVVKGALVKAPRIKNSPARHAALRVAAGVAGARLIGALKDRMIFAKPSSDYDYRRTVEITDAGVRVVDEISGLAEGDSVFASPRSSRRHVASADSYHDEDITQRGFEHVATAGEPRFVRDSFHPYSESQSEPT